MKTLHCLIVVLLALGPAAASPLAAGDRPLSTASSVAMAPAPTYTAPVPLLWKVSDDDNSIYLLGSFHLLKAGDYPLSPDIHSAFTAAGSVVFEVPPGSLDDPGTALKFLAAAGYLDGQTLEGVLPGVLREKLHRLLARQGGSLAQLNAYEPWFVNLSLVLGLSQSLGFDPQLGLDQHLMRMAAAADKPVAGLESIDDQLRALDSQPLDEQITALADFLDRPQEMPGTLDELHQAWRSGDLVRLDALTRLEMRERTPETYRIVNVDRNQSWLPQLRAMLDHGTDDVLVVVGALHLLGEDGVVDGLRADGYAVERVCSACAPVPEHAAAKGEALIQSNP